MIGRDKQRDEGWKEGAQYYTGQRRLSPDARMEGGSAVP